MCLTIQIVVIELLTNHQLHLFPTRSMVVETEFAECQFFATYVAIATCFVGLLLFKLYTCKNYFSNFDFHMILCILVAILLTP